MALTNPEVRVLASLIEKEAAVPESYPLTLTALRLACNQSTNRRPVVTYDDRTVENALMSLKSVGLVRFVHPSHGGRTTRYRHTVGERWRLSPGECIVLSALALRGAQTAAEVRGRVARLLDDETAPADDMLDTLAARSPEALAIRLGRRPGERDDRWAAALGDRSADDEGDDPGDGESVIDELTGERDPAPDAELDAELDIRRRGTQALVHGHGNSGHRDELAERVEQLGATIATVAARLERLERELGVTGFP